MELNWTIRFLIAITAIFIVQQLTISWTGFAFVPSAAFKEPWTFVTSIFLHADFSHLFFNGFALLVFGSFLESRIEEKHFILIFFLAGIVGNFGYMLTSGNPDIPGIGASGAIYGIMGALAVLSPFTMVYVGYVPMPMIVAAFFWTASEFLGLFVPSGIARGAHLGGLFFGIVYGLYLRRQSQKERHYVKRPYRW